MALVNCPECGKQVSDLASSCPHCGCPLKGVSAPPGQSAPSNRGSGRRKTHPAVMLLAIILLVGGVGGIYLFWRSLNSDSAAPPTAGLAGVLRQPEKLADERIELHEGQYKAYSFSLRSDARVRVAVQAAPKSVDVMLMNSSDFKGFQKASRKLFGGKYTYREALSGQQILSLEKTEMVPSGHWTLVVMRPAEALLFKKGTSASVTVTVY